MRFPFIHKHSWVFIGLRVVDNPNYKKPVKEDGNLHFAWFLDYDYERCRKCGKTRPKGSWGKKK